MSTEAEKKLLEQIKRLAEETDEARLESLKKQGLELKAQQDTVDKLATYGETMVGHGDLEIEQAQNRLDIKKLELKLAGDLDTAKIKEIADEERLLDIKRQGYNDAEGFAKKFMGITREPTSEFGKFLVDPEARLEGLSAGLGEVVDGMSIMTSTVDKVVETTVKLALENDQAVVNFRRATGASGEFDDNIRGLERSLFTAGVTSAEASQAVQSLFVAVTDFTEMSDRQQEVLSETVAILNELGVASDTTSKNIQFATKVLGQSTTQAAALQRELFVFAQDLGVSADQIASDFQSMGPQIAALGTNGVDAFRKLEVQAKNTGLQLSEILGIVEQFDKFDTAAQAVGKLNALLGGPYLNTLELVAETDPSKRFEILKDNVDAAGLSFDQMDYYQRKALASAIGINEQQLALMMRGRLDLISEPAKSAADIEALADQTAQFNTIMEEMQQMAMMTAIALGPLISGLKSVMDAFQVLFPFLEPIIIGLAGVALGFAAMNVSISAGPLIALVAVGAALAGIYHFFGPEGLLAAGLIVAAGAVLIFGSALSFATMGILPLLGGLVTLATYFFHKIASPGLIEILGMAAAAVMLLPPAMLALGGAIIIMLPFLPMLALGLVVLMRMLPALAVGLTLVSQAVTQMITDEIVKNIQLMAIEIGNIVDKINELDTVKTVAFTTATVATGVSSAALGAIGLARDVATGGAGGGGPGEAPTINISLNVDGTEFATAVNKVEISKYTGEGTSDMYASVIDMISAGISKGG